MKVIPTLLVIMVCLTTYTAGAEPIQASPAQTATDFLRLLEKGDVDQAMKLWAGDTDDARLKTIVQDMSEKIIRSDGIKKLELPPVEKRPQNLENHKTVVIVLYGNDQLALASLSFIKEGAAYKITKLESDKKYGGTNCLFAGAMISVDARNVNRNSRRDEGQIQQDFSEDPGWEELNNRLTPDPGEVPTVVQDYGYSETNFAGGEKGEIGGQVWRSATPSFYAAAIPVKTLDEKLNASGKFWFTDPHGSAGIWFGWFQGEQTPGIARPRNGLGMDMDFEENGGRLAVRLSNEENKFCGTFVTPYIPGRFRPAPLMPDTQYVWNLTYDPQANEGNGRIEFSIHSVGMSEENRARVATMQAEAAALPADMQAQFGPKHGRPDFDGAAPFVVDLPPGFRQTGASFDHFGLMSNLKEGRPVTIYFDDLAYDGTTEDFSQDSGWEGLNNRAQLAETAPSGYHNFGFSPETNLAGGAAPGEMGGIFWRLSKAYAYYADRVGPLTLNDTLEASGRLTLKVGSPDSEICFGWFDSAQKEIPQEFLKQEGHLEKTENFIGVYLAGPSRLGRCLIPAVVGARGTRNIYHEVDEVPRLTPEESYTWSIRYNPAAQQGNGELTIMLNDQLVTMPLDPKLKAEGAHFDRFGFFPSGGGGMIEIYFDDLSYTAGRR